MKDVARDDSFFEEDLNFFKNELLGIQKFKRFSNIDKLNFKAGIEANFNLKAINVLLLAKMLSSLIIFNAKTVLFFTSFNPITSNLQF